jgi:hypothetical protein
MPPDSIGIGAALKMDGTDARIVIQVLGACDSEPPRHHRCLSWRFVNSECPMKFHFLAATKLSFINYAFGLGEVQETT